MSSTSTKLFTPIGTRAIGLAWSNVIRAFTFGDTENVTDLMELFAATPGDPDIMDKFFEWRKCYEQNLEVKNSELTYTQADLIPKQRDIINFKKIENRKIYSNLVKLLREEGYLDFASNRPPTRKRELKDIGEKVE